MGPQHVREHQIVDVALVAGHQDQGALLGACAYPAHHVVVDRDSLEHEFEEPSDQKFPETDDSDAHVRCDFVDVALGFPVDLGQGDVPLFRVLFHERAQALAGQDVFLEFRKRFHHRAGDALPVAVGPVDERAPDVHRQLLQRQVLVFGPLQVLLEVERLGGLRENLVRLLEQRHHTPQVARRVFRPEKNVDKRGHRPRGPLGKKDQLRNDVGRAVDRFLHLDQIPDGVCLGFDEAPVEPLGFHQGQKARLAGQELLAHVSAVVWVQGFAIFEEVMDVGHDHPQDLFQRLQGYEPVIHADLGEGQLLLLESGVKEQKIKIALALGGVDHHGVFGQVPDGHDLVLLGPDALVEQPQKQRTQKPDAPGYVAEKMVVRALQELVQPALLRWLAFGSVDFVRFGHVSTPYD